MADREKVIKGLEHCRQYGTLCGKDCSGVFSYTDNYEDIVKSGEHRHDCPYGKCKTGCVVTLVDDALALLKEQEPRVMDADEIVLSTDPSKWLWVERKGDYCAEAFKAGKTISGLISFDSETPGAFLYCERPDEYGKTWRCWSSRPTDEQREAVKWE